jgi:beta-lactamase class A
MFTRRASLAGGLALAACAHRGEPSREDRVANLIRVLEEEVGGRIGVAALDTETGARIAYRADERFAMCSTFKWLLAAAALEQLHRDEVLSFGQVDIVTYSPTTSVRVSEGGMTVQDLCEAAVVRSDNTAANVLIRRLGGPYGVTDYWRNHVDSVTRLDRMEPELNENAPGDPRDTTTPVAMVNAMRRLLVRRDGLRRANRDALIGWLIACETGLDRLRGGLPADWRAGDKTGSWNGEHNATNDVAIAWPPAKQKPILIVAYMSDSTTDITARKAALARIGRMVAAAWG